MTEKEYQQLADEVVAINQKIEILNSHCEMINNKRKKILVELGLSPNIEEAELQTLIEEAKEKTEQAFIEMNKAKAEKELEIKKLQEVIGNYERN